MMTDEEYFQSHLDAHPDDSLCRLAFSDWLEERGDPRALGYRALGLLGLHPVKITQWNHMYTNMVLGIWNKYNQTGLFDSTRAWWFKLSPKDTRRECDDEAAFRFYQMQSHYQSAILNAPDR